jgi:hypothetical protein
VQCSICTTARIIIRCRVEVRGCRSVHTYSRLSRRCGAVLYCPVHMLVMRAAGRYAELLGRSVGVSSQGQKLFTDFDSTIHTLTSLQYCMIRSRHTHTHTGSQALFVHPLDAASSVLSDDSHSESAPSLIGAASPRSFLAVAGCVCARARSPLAHRFDGLHPAFSTSSLHHSTIAPKRQFFAALVSMSRRGG